MNRTRIPGSTYCDCEQARMGIRRPAQRSTRWGFVVLMFVMMSSAFGFEVSLEPVRTVGYEATGQAATATLQRRDGQGALNVELEVLSSSFALPVDYELEWLNISPTGSVWQELGSDEATSGLVSFRDGQQNISIRIRPIDDLLVERAEDVIVNIVKRPEYNPGGFSSRTFIIADDDHKARIKMTRPLADEDVSLRGDPDDLMSLRRGVIQVLFDEFANNGPVGFEYAQRTDFLRNLSVEIGEASNSRGPLPDATLGVDYVIKYRICGHNNPATGTGTYSQLGSARNVDTGLSSTTGLNYKLMAALAGESTVPLKEQDSDDTSANTIPSGTVFYFESDPTKRLYTTVGNAVSALTFNPTLNRSIPSGTKVKITSVGGGGSAPDSVIVEAVYAASSTVLKVGGGWGELYEGDVISIEGDDIPYVITADPVMAPDVNGRYSAEISIFAHEGGGGGGLAVPQTGAAAVTTLLTPRIDADGKTMQIGVPDISTRVEFSIEPVGMGDGAEKAEFVNLKMIADYDYYIVSPTDSTVTIADRDVVVGVKVGTSAGLPDIQGTLIFTLSKPFPDNSVDVTFDLESWELDSSGSRTTTIAEGRSFEPLPRVITIPKGMTTYSLSVVPKAGGFPADLTVSLLGTEHYKTGGSSSSGSNPSATMHISNVIGTVSIVATDATAVEGSSTDTGLFTVTVNRLPLQTVEVPLKLVVGGTAVAGRFEFFNPTTPTETYSVSSTGFIDLSVTKINPAPTTTFRIGVRAIDNQSADGAGSIQLSLNNQGTNYVIGTPASAVVSILDNEPTLSIAVVQNASRPSTPGSFRFSYPGIPLNSTLDQKITVKYTFTDAVLGTDFEAQTTVDIAANDPNRYADLIINPTAAGTATSLKVILTADPGYHIAPPGFATMTFTAAEDNDPARDKPTPGSISSGSGGGCGLGSGLSALMGLLITLGWIGLRRRSP